jgi:hypothetical protein
MRVILITKLLIMIIHLIDDLSAAWTADTMCAIAIWPLFIDTTPNNVNQCLTACESS